MGTGHRTSVIGAGLGILERRPKVSKFAGGEKKEGDDFLCPKRNSIRLV